MDPSTLPGLPSEIVGGPEKYIYTDFNGKLAAGVARSNLARTNLVRSLRDPWILKRWGN